MVADKLKSYIQEPIAYERLTGADVHLDFCRSCESCFSTGKCPADAGDDMGMIKQKMLEADMLFFCSPVYAGSMSATAKAVVDRLAYWCHREELAGKPTAVLVTISNNHGKETVEDISDTLQYMGVSLAWAGFVCTHDHPNIYLEEDMEPELEKICTALADGWRDPIKFITPKQSLAFRYYARMYNRQRIMNQIFNLKPSAEVLISTEREFMKYKNLQDYVKNLLEKKRAEQSIP